MSDMDYIEPAKVVAWIFERRERVPEYAGKPDGQVLAWIIKLVQTCKLHVALDEENQLVGVILYERQPRWLYIRLILTDPPVTLHALTAAWLRYYPGVSVLGWRKKCKKVVEYTQEQVLRALKLMVPDLHPLEICKN